MPPGAGHGRQGDPYSLGAMLYDTVKGHLSFLGDDSVGIIGQHINTTVARSRPCRCWFIYVLVNLSPLRRRPISRSPRRPLAAQQAHSAFNVTLKKARNLPSQESGLWLLPPYTRTKGCSKTGAAFSASQYPIPIYEPDSPNDPP